MRSVVLIPTYNEIDSLPTALDRVRSAAVQAHILVIDDNSPDGTGDLADARAQDDDHIHVLHRTEKNGLGPAYLAGFKWALENDFELIIEMADKPDLVIGSRWISGGATQGWSQKRVLLSRAGNVYINLALGLNVRDATAGFRVYRADLLRRMDLNKVEALGYGFQVNMTLLVYQAGGRIVEMPITFLEREAGESKLSGGIFTEELKLVTRWGLKHRGKQLRQALGKMRK